MEVDENLPNFYAAVQIEATTEMVDEDQYYKRAYKMTLTDEKT